MRPPLSCPLLQPRRISWLPITLPQTRLSSGPSLKRKDKPQVNCRFKGTISAPHLRTLARMPRPPRRIWSTWHPRNRPSRFPPPLLDPSKAWWGVGSFPQTNSQSVLIRLLGEALPHSLHLHLKEQVKRQVMDKLVEHCPPSYYLAERRVLGKKEKPLWKILQLCVS